MLGDFWHWHVRPFRGFVISEAVLPNQAERVYVLEIREQRAKVWRIAEYEVPSLVPTCIAQSPAVANSPALRGSGSRQVCQTDPAGEVRRFQLGLSSLLAGRHRITGCGVRIASWRGKREERHVVVGKIAGNDAPAFRGAWRPEFRGGEQDHPTGEIEVRLRERDRNATKHQAEGHLEDS